MSPACHKVESGGLNRCFFIVGYVTSKTGDQVKQTVFPTLQVAHQAPLLVPQLLLRITAMLEGCDRGEDVGCSQPSAVEEEKRLRFSQGPHFLCPNRQYPL